MRMGTRHGFVLNKGVFRDVFTTIDVPGAAGTFLNGINASGQLVGTYVDADPDTTHAFVRGNERQFYDARPSRRDPIARRLHQRERPGRGNLQGYKTKNVMASSGATASSPHSTCRATTQCSGRWPSGSTTSVRWWEIMWMANRRQRPSPRFPAEQQRRLHDVRCARRGFTVAKESTTPARLWEFMLMTTSTFMGSS